MTTWLLSIQKGWRMGLAFIVGLVLLSAAMIVIVVLTPLSILTFLLSVVAIACLVGAGFVGYWLWGLVNAAYTMDRNAVVIHWGYYEYQIPLTEIIEVLPGEEVAGLRLRNFFHWPGYFVGKGEATDLGTVLFYATQPPEGQLILRTADDLYAISPVDREGFVAALRERQEMGATQDVEARFTHPAFLEWPIWGDRTALGILGSSLLLLLLLVAGLSGFYPFLPPEVPLQIANTGEVLRVVRAGRIFYLPLLGVIFTVVNGVLGFYLYPRERMVAYFLWSGLLLLQGALWVAVATVLLNL